MKKSATFSTAKTRWVGICLAVFLICSPNIGKADILEWPPPGGAGTLVQGVIFELNVTHPQGILVTQLSAQLRGDNVTRDFEILYRGGAHDDLIGGLPAHRVPEEWTQIGTASNLTFAASTTHPFLVNVTLGTGIHSFYLNTTASTGSMNGVRTVAVPDITAGTVLASDSNLEIIAAGSKGSLFGTTIPSDNNRTPGHLIVEYQVIPEPGSGIVLAGLLLVCGLGRRRV